MSFLPPDIRQWPFYPIEMPLTAKGDGPAKVGRDAVKITYEVWDRACKSHASCDNLPDAINEAIRLSSLHPELPLDLSQELRMVSNIINMGEKIAWGRETSLMDQAADRIEALTAERDAALERIKALSSAARTMQ